LWRLFAISRGTFVCSRISSGRSKQVWASKNSPFAKYADPMLFSARASPLRPPFSRESDSASRKSGSASSGSLTVALSSSEPVRNQSRPLSQ
jgi:hypothetical protein